MESELFGHMKGSFTGATQDKKGLFAAAHKGTVFLDEIGELSMPLQVKLLRVVQEKSFKPVGSNEDIEVDCRIISATNKNLAKEVIEGRFREDLFYRLNVIEIKVPPLRERKGDLKALAQHFLDKYSREMGKEIKKLSSYAVDLMNKYDFPGNVRELENLMERSVALTSTNIILPESLALSVHKRRWIEGVEGKRYDLDDVAKGIALDVVLREIEYAYLQKGLEIADGNKNRAAELLGITFRSFRHRLGKMADDK
jgi:two-component system response regulator PilR (NtrC family)